MGTINTFNFYPEAIDKAATKAKEAACSATETIKHKISDAALNLKDKASNILDQVDTATSHQTEALLKSRKKLKLKLKVQKPKYEQQFSITFFL